MSIRRVYEQIFSRTDLRLPDDRDIYWQHIRRLLPTSHEVRILDAGCGNGRYSLKLAELGYRNLFAVDLFEAPLRSAEFDYRQASLDALPFEDDQFDFVICNSVLYYLDDPAAGLREFRRVLQPGARVFFTCHTAWSLYTLWRFLKRMAGLESVEHLKGVQFQPASYYLRALRDNGFEVELVDGCLKWTLIRHLERLTGYRIGLLQPRPTRWRWLARLKATVGYHFLIAARKTRAGGPAGGVCLEP